MRGHRLYGRRTFLARATAAATALVVVLTYSVAPGSPGDIFSISAPVIGSDPPKAADIQDGDASVATMTGALNFSYPIKVPPGRGKMAPSLALAYSSQAPLYGSLASGWSLSIPMIQEDTSHGRLRTHSPEVEGQEGVAAAGHDDRFTSSLAGGRPLVAVDEPFVTISGEMSSGVEKTYRAQNDGSFARYRRMGYLAPYRWRVDTTDGTSHFFGDAANAPGCPISDGFAPLTRSVDQFGNEIKYEYIFANRECLISKITYGQNATAGLAPFAEVVVQSKRASLCEGIEIGSQASFRTGREIVTGSNEITAIVAKAFDPATPGTALHTRTIALTYASPQVMCSNASSAVRLLESIQETAVGVDSPQVALPPVTFTYGPTVVDLPSSWTVGTHPWPGAGARTYNLGWGIRRHGDDRWPTVEATLLDVDGDGRLDRLENATATVNGVTNCRATWRRNVPGQTMFGAAQELTFGSSGGTKMPMLRWNGPATETTSSGSLQAGENHLEGCALNGQVTAFHNSNKNAAFCHDGTSCTPDTYCSDGNLCPSGTTLTSPRTYLAYRWLDMDGDGLTDLVTAVHGSPYVYNIIRGNDFVNGVQVPYEPALFGTVPIPSGLPSCTGVPDKCKALGTDCMSRITPQCNGNEICELAWPEVNACVAAAQDDHCQIEVGTSDLTKVAGGDPANTPPPGAMVSERQPYQLCNGLYPWFIFKNRGNGNFDDTPVIKYQPVPLESDAGDSAIAAPKGIAGQTQGALDLDGDGLPDGIAQARDKDLHAHPWWWYVWPNDGTGGFGPRRYVWRSRDYPIGHLSGYLSSIGFTPGSAMGLVDINGDGLADHWLANLGAPTANVAYNNGTGFRAYNQMPPTAGEFTTNATRPGSDPLVQLILPEGNLIKTGVRYSQRRALDLDADGRVDVVEKAALASAPSVRFNQGGQFSSNQFSYGPGDAAAQKISADDDGTWIWQHRQDLIDLDGDGLLEAVGWDDALNYVKAVNPLTSGPPRLMKTISNGRGATTTVTYASMHDTTTVVQAPDETWSDGRPKASPSHQWVVKSLSTVDTFASTTTPTSYFYKNPRHGADDEGRYSFRGFEEVTTTRPSGAKTVQRYGYTPDWSGRLVKTLVVPAEDPTKVRSIDATSWQERMLNLGGSVYLRTYHPSVTEHFTCANDQTEATCTAANAPGYTRTTMELSGISALAGGSPLLFTETRTTLRSGTADADGDRETLQTYDLLASDAEYRLRPRLTTKNHRVSGTMTLFGKSESVWDASYRVPLTESVWFDAIDANKATTAKTFDMNTGNVLTRKKPRQYAAGTSATTYTYDSRKLFVATEVNEVGHQFDYLYEYGTGTKLQTEGPNTRGCTSNCPSGPSYTVKEQHKIRVDGLGREIEKWDTTSDDGAIYTVYQTTATSYVDTISGTSPTSFTKQTRLEATPTSVWKQEKTELDGHGRPIKVTVFSQGSAPFDQVTTFGYRNDGTLAGVTVPDPTANNASVVGYLYNFDSLGRATQIRRPDTAVLFDQSGVDITYDGTTKTTTEVVGTAGGQIAVTKTVGDKFGRLEEVHEQLTGGATPTWAVTTYSYGPDDIVNTVVDPQSVTTTMTHDFAGHRTQITRAGGRTWKYGYDKNGNVISEQVPGSPSPPTTDYKYTTTIAYDDLDRPTSKVIGQRELSASDQTLFGSNTETLTVSIRPTAGEDL